jgi:hypothetical protein
MIARRRGLTCHAAIRREALAGLKAAAHEVDLLDLYADSFDPVLTQKARRRYQQCPAESRRARKHDRPPDFGGSDRHAIPDLVASACRQCCRVSATAS